MIYVRQLTPAELEDLRVFMRSTRDARLLKRAQMIWLSNQGWGVPDIANALDVDPETVREWIKRYEERGLEGLRDEERSGRPRKADDLYVETLLDLVPKSPRLVGIRANIWTLSLLSEHLENELGIRVSIERVRQILLEHKIRFTRPKLHVESPDPEYDEKISRIRQRLGEADENTVALFLDEADFHLNPRIAPAWQEDRARVQSAGRVNRKLFVFGAANVETRSVDQRVTTRKTSRQFCDFLRQLARTHEGKHVLIITDNYKVHKTKRVDATLEHLDGQIEILFLPTYSPQLNPIEPWWKFEKKHVITNVFHESVNGLRQAIRSWHDDYENGLVPAYGFTMPQKWQGLC